MSTILEELQKIFRDVFDDEELILNEGTGPDDIEDWDSLAQMELLAIVTQKYEIQITPEEMLALKTVGDIAALIERKQR